MYPEEKSSCPPRSPAHIRIFFSSGATSRYLIAWWHTSRYSHRGVTYQYVFACQSYIPVCICMSYTHRTSHVAYYVTFWYVWLPPSLLNQYKKSAAKPTGMSPDVGATYCCVFLCFCAPVGFCTIFIIVCGVLWVGISSSGWGRCWQTSETPPSFRLEMQIGSASFQKQFVWW